MWRAHRLGSTLSTTSTAGGGVLVSAPSAPPAVMPVFPLRPAPQYSPYSSSRFHIDKRCRHRCSWKCCSIALILLSAGLTAMLAYFGGNNTLFPLTCIKVILLKPGLHVFGRDHTSLYPVTCQLSLNGLYLRPWVWTISAAHRLRNWTSTGTVPLAECWDPIPGPLAPESDSLTT